MIGHKLGDQIQNILCHNAERRFNEAQRKKDGHFLAMWAKLWMRKIPSIGREGESCQIGAGFHWVPGFEEAPR